MTSHVAISYLITLGLLTASLGAQETTGAIIGSTVDETGTLLPGVTVTITDVNQGRVAQFTTNHSARYTATLSPGEYELRFELAGFSMLTITGVSLHTNDHLRVDAMLTRGGEARTSAFPLKAQLVQPSSEMQNLISGAELQELPLINRNFVQLATLAPGVSSDLEDEVETIQYLFGGSNYLSLSVHGARRSHTQWLVDGASYVDAFNNSQLFMTPSLESFRELKLITGGQGAEAPRGGGGTVNVVTKSGTSKFSGSFYEFLRNDKLNANSFFRNASPDPNTREKPPRLRSNNFGYTIGGPGIPGRENLFFFFSQEWRRISREHVRAFFFVPDPTWLTDPSSPNYVAPDERDPNAVKLLAAWPAPNVPGTNFFQGTNPDTTDTHQETVRLDYQPRLNWRLTGRYSHDLSERADPFPILPQRKAGRTSVPTHGVVAQLSTFLGRGFNELSYRFSENNISQKDPKGTKTTRQAYGIDIPESFAGNRGGLIPSIGVSGLDFVTVFRDQAYKYRNHTAADNLLVERGDHTLKMGALFAFEEKDGKFAGDATQGSFNFAQGGGLTAFQNFLRGNRDGRCGSACTYSEDDLDVRNQLRFNTYEAYLQEIWRFRPNLTFNFGLRYSLFTPVQDKNDLLLTFSPQAFDPAQVPAFADAFGSFTVLGTGNPLNGWFVAGKNSPYGRSIYAWDKNNVQPRLGFAWDPRRNGEMIVRGAYGIFYAPPPVSIFMQNTQESFPNPLQRRIDISNPSLSNPSAGAVVTPATEFIGERYATSDRFLTPRIQQWNLGMQRSLYRRGVIEIGYAGSRGEHLVRPVDINQPQPQDLLAAGGRTNLVRPYKGYDSIYMRETSAQSWYHGLLASFRHAGGRAGTLVLNYTLSRNKTDATLDNDTLFGLPQNPLDKHAEFAAAQTDRTHVFSGYYVYELPFFRRSGETALKALLGGWQVAGITTAASGPAARLRVGITRRPNQVGDPGAGDQAGLLWFNPGAFVLPAPGTYGTAPVAPLRLPGYHQWDISPAKNFYLGEEIRLQLRADFINAFNQTQFRDVNTSCCGRTQFNSSFGEVVTMHAPREIQLGFRFFW